MKNKLILRAELEDILELPDVPSMVDYLLNGPYAQEMAVALRAHPPVRAIERGLEANMVVCFERIRRYAGQDGDDLLSAVAESWDIRSLKTVFRGLHRKLHASEILELTEAGVQLKRNLLEVLASEDNVVDAVTTLSSWSMPWGDVLQPLLRDYRESGNLRPLEFALDQHRFHIAERSLQLDGASRKLLHDFLSAEAEIVNISTCLVHLNSEEKPQLLDQGSRSTKLVKKLYQATTYDEVVAAFSESLYRRQLDRALPSLMMHNGSYTVLERLLDEALLIQTWRSALLDPLGGAVPYHYLRCKRNEVMNLRLIARGLGNGLPRNMLRLSLVYAPEPAA